MILIVLLAATSATAARIFNIYPRKGCIAPGSDADVVVWNPNRTRVISAKTHHHAVDFNIFEGQEVHGVAEWVVTGGRVVVEEGELRAVARGAGQYVNTPPFSPYVYDRVKEAEEALQQIQNEKYRVDFCYLSHLARCYIMNNEPHQAWDAYVRMETSNESFNLLHLIANDCYKMGQFYYSAKAFDMLERLDPNPEYWEGKRGAAIGLFQMIIAGRKTKAVFLSSSKSMSPVSWCTL